MKVRCELNVSPDKAPCGEPGDGGCKREYVDRGEKQKKRNQKSNVQTLDQKEAE